MDLIKSKLNLLPEKPGVYLMKDSKDQIIYVGKAKVLKNRVRSYFTGSHDTKTQALVSQIKDFEYIITDSEVEALILECNLIKKYDPKYNILLKDDKSYPYLTITDETHPRILITRQVKKGSGKYFGPYPNASAAREAAQLLNRLFPLRKCTQVPKRPCLYYHLAQCLGPCIDTISPESYTPVIKQITNFLRGDQREIIRQLEDKMKTASESLQFERAKEYRDLIEDLRILNEKQNIILTDFLDRDILGFDYTKDEICIQIFYLRQGKLIARDTFILPFYEEPEDALISFIAQFYSEKTTIPEEILLPASIDMSLLSKLFPVTIPRKGKKVELVEMAMTNAKTTLHEQILLEANRQQKNTQALEYLGTILGIPTPVKIEAFDISNTSGTNPVGGMVQFVDGKPMRTAYRKYKIHEMQTNDDTASMWQVIDRRYSKLVSENSPLPDLILVDGGKGQISAAKQALKNLNITIPVAGMVKNERHQTAGLMNQYGVLLEIENAETFNLLERIQNEVHRFAITFHRQQRLKHMILSELDGIPGIGPARRQQLLRKFSTIDQIKKACLDELQEAGLPRNAAEAVHNFFQSKKDN